MQLPENEENIVEDQPTEAVDSDADDNENQEDFSEEIEDEDTESSLENEDYPGEDVVEIINLRGETTTVYKLFLSNKPTRKWSKSGITSL